MPTENMKLRVSAFTILIPTSILLIAAGVLFVRARTQNAIHHRLNSVQSMLERTLIPGLNRNPDVISMKEFNALTMLLKHGVPRLLYLNKSAEIRFNTDRATAKRCTHCPEEIAPYSVGILDAIETSWETHLPTVIRFGSSNDNDIIIPLVLGERPLGMVLFRANDSVLASLPEALIMDSTTSNQKQDRLEAIKAKRRDPQESNFSARQYRRLVENLFAATRPSSNIQR